ncbi:MAG: acyloxyacyl hydrolase [Acidobacteriaceae bacterium]
MQALIPIAVCFAFSAAQATAQSNISTLPSAPQPQLNSQFSLESGSQSDNPDNFVSLQECPYRKINSPRCRVHWRQLVISTAAFVAFLNAGNLYTGYWYRWETTHGEWFNRWISSAADWEWNRWSDSNPALDQYLGHPMMGAITNDLWRQNDPKSMTLVQSNTWVYWRGILRATAFTTAVHFEWKFGPFGEAGIGHNGDHPQDQSNGTVTYGTGDVELVTTPVVGGLWTLAEDALDEHVIAHLEQRGRNPFALLSYQFLNPARATANIFRFRPPWYRDPRPGGVHEFGAWWGFSLISGHIWGYAKDIKYMPIDIRYSYLFSLHRHWAMRYSPEVTALAMLDEPVPNQTNRFLQRRRTYGSGISPVGFQSDFFPSRRVQPFLSTNGGAIYFTNRVLSPEGAHFMYTVDFGCGINIFRKARQAVTIGYRNQHLSNANISLHNPGTDANTFYVAVSRFRMKGFR